MSARLLLTGDLGCFDPAWTGWRLAKGVLYSPEGWALTPSETLAVPLLRAQLNAYQMQLREMREAAASLEDQPEPESWSFGVG